MKFQNLIALLGLYVASAVATEQAEEESNLRRRLLLDPQTVVMKNPLESRNLAQTPRFQTLEQQGKMLSSCHPSRHLTTNHSQTLPDFIKAVFTSLAHVQTGERPLSWVVKNFNYLTQQRGALASGTWTEFGVFAGSTLKEASDNLGQQGFTGTLAGFDSFEGLPSKWRNGFDAGTFGGDVAGGNLFNYVRNLLPPSVELYKGWFQDTIGPFLMAHEGAPSTLIHHDGDLFVSTAITFALMNERIVPGTLICFDEIFGYPGFEQHEVMSLQLWMREHDVTLCPIAVKGPLKMDVHIGDVKFDVDPTEQSACFQVLDMRK